ncbi:hypothetical protein FACS189426_11640 [Bacteroidia bacterium]|nr:hypothetical protein FACS189426_11640 [Bacteroidia bacterium]
MPLIKQNNFEELINNVYQTHCILQANATRAINLNLTVRNWLVGCYIVEFEQNGEDRAKYGTRLLEEMAKSVKEKGVKGLNLRTLRNCRILYVTYPQIRQTVSAELKNEQQLSVLPALADDTNIRLTVSAKSDEEMVLPPELLLTRLTFSHFIELIRVDDDLSTNKEAIIAKIKNLKSDCADRRD